MAQAKKALSKTSGKVNSRNASRAAVKTYQNYIDGHWVASQSGEMFENINPADTRDIVGRFPLSTSDDVNAAVNAAQGAFDRWRNTPAPKRAEILFRLGEILIRDKERYTSDMTREMGKVLKEAGGDVQEAIDCTYYTAGEGRRLHGFTTPAEMRDKFAMCVRQPVGLCGLITPWNFPMAMGTRKIGPAVAAGCTMGRGEAKSATRPRPSPFGDCADGAKCAARPRSTSAGPAAWAKKPPRRNTVQFTGRPHRVARVCLARHSYRQEPFLVMQRIKNEPLRDSPGRWPPRVTC